MRAVIFPNQVRDVAKQKAEELGIGKGEAPQPKSKASPAKAPTSAWEATTSGAPERRP